MPQAAPSANTRRTVLTVRESVQATCGEKTAPPHSDAAKYAAKEAKAEAVSARRRIPPTTVTSSAKHTAQAGVPNSAEKPAAMPATSRMRGAPARGTRLPMPPPIAAPICTAAPSLPTLAQKRCALHVPAN